MDERGVERGRIRILVVDDNKAIFLLLSRLLAPKGHEVYWASSGEEAVTLAKRETFDIVFLDLLMRGMGGERTLAWFREAQPGTAVVICSVVDESEARERLFRMGATAFLSKPFYEEAIDEVIQKLVKERSEGRISPTPRAGGSFNDG